jgi:N-acetylglucosaminyl-diphospho-decaprenol L-rhamnosyltransferase
VDLATIIVNYRAAALVADCLRSLSPEPHGPVVVVDNASGDDSVTRLRSVIDEEKGSDWCHLLPMKNNAGYAAGNNAGIRHVQQTMGTPNYFLLLNPDTTVRPRAISTLLEFMRTNPRVGIAGSRLEDQDGTPQRSAFRFPSILGELESGLRLGVVTRLLHGQAIAPPVRNEAHVTDWVAGASMIVRREVIENVGLMDEGYFLYFEEVDYCRKAKRAGWPCWYVPSSHVVHLVGQSTGVTDMKSEPRRIPDYWFASRRRYFRNNHGAMYARLADATWASSYALWRVRRRLQRKPDTDPPGMLGDFLRYNFGRQRRATA